LALNLSAGWPVAVRRRKPLPQRLAAVTKARRLARALELVRRLQPASEWFQEPLLAQVAVPLAVARGRRPVPAPRQVRQQERVLEWLREQPSQAPQVEFPQASGRGSQLARQGALEAVQ